MLFIQFCLFVSFVLYLLNDGIREIQAPNMIDRNIQICNVSAETWCNNKQWNLF